MRSLSSFLKRSKQVVSKKISLFSLTLLIVAAIDSIRTLPTTAYFGSSLLFFYFLAATLFFVPVALISAEFSSRSEEEGGIFHWVKRAFGPQIGALAVWLQWINTMVWYPTMLLFIAGTVGYFVHPSLAQNPLFLLIVSLGAFWMLTLLNLRGVQASVRLSTVCASLGTLFPMLFLIGLGVWWFFSHGSSTLSSASSFSLLEGSNALVTVMASLVGMELAGVYIRDIAQPQKNFPKAIAYSSMILLGTLILGSLSIAVIVPQSEIHFVDGVMQTFTVFLSSCGLSSLVPILALLITIGAVGGSVNWILSPAHSLKQMAQEGFLPPSFLVENKRGAPKRILIAQALVVTLFSSAVHFAPSINSYYWFLMALSTGLYMLMYILLFLGALKLGRSGASYSIPRGIRTVSCLGGILASLLTIGIGLQPAPGTDFNPFSYSLLALFGFLILLAPVPLFWRYQKNFLQKV